MKAGQTARLALREATASWHERVDSVFSTADLSDRAGYARFLTAQAAAYLPVEQALDRSGAAELLPDWERRRRGNALIQDLAALGCAIPPPLDPPAFPGPAALLGGIYVLEGSRLGGAMLRRSVPAGFPTAFLDGGDSGLWRDLLQVLDQRLATREDLAAATEAACNVFAVFETGGQRFLTGENVS